MTRWLLLPAVLCLATPFAATAQTPEQAEAIDARLAAADERADDRQWRRAEAELTAAQQILDESASPDPLIAARIEAGWMDYLRTRERFDEAADHGRTALNLTLEGEGSDRAVGDIAYSYGYVAYRAGRYTEAQAVFMEAGSRYAVSRDADDRRRWRNQGWLELAENALSVHEGDYDEDTSRLNGVTSPRMTRLTDEALGQWLNADLWTETPPIEIPGASFLGEVDGFVVATFRFDDAGQPIDIEIVSSYPGDLYDEGVITGLENGRADPAAVTPGEDYALVFSIVQE